MRKGKARSKAFRQVNAASGFREYDLHAYAAQFNREWLGNHLDINTIQKLATRAFKAAQQHAFGKRGRPRFKGKNQMDSLEGKTNQAGIRWREPEVKWLGLDLQAVIPEGDPVVNHGLQARVKFARIVRRKLNGKNRFYVQLICEGQPYRKPQHPIGQGVVGLDIGPSTIACVSFRHNGSETEALLLQFCADLEDRQREIRRLQRKVDRQRRANNPDNYNPNGTVKKGAKRWPKSKRQRRTEARVAELQRKQAAHRKSLHGQLANHILSLGNIIKTEKLSYRAFQRMFGRSVQFRAPGTFVSILRRKAESADEAAIDEFPTRTTKLSRVCHNCGQVKAKGLSVRWHDCDCGIVAQRDLYSAFLATCVEVDADGTSVLNADLARQRWSGVDTRLQAALSQAVQRNTVRSPNATQPASGRRLPSSFGVSRRQSGSLAKSAWPGVKAQDVVIEVVERQHVAPFLFLDESLRETSAPSEPQVL
jgi:transposase